MVTPNAEAAAENAEPLGSGVASPEGNSNAQDHAAGTGEAAVSGHQQGLSSSSSAEAASCGDDSSAGCRKPIGAAAPSDIRSVSPYRDDEDESDDLGARKNRSSNDTHSKKALGTVPFSAVGSGGGGGCDASSTASTTPTAASFEAQSIATTASMPADPSTLVLMPAESGHSVASVSSSVDQHSMYDTVVSDHDHSEASFAEQHQHHAPQHLLHHLHEQPIQEVPAEEPLDTNAHYCVLNFVMEERIFLKAALDLLTERDRAAPELGMMDPIILKSGSLKKASHLMSGVWKVKYVEIRRGMFSYYENAVSNTTSSSSMSSKKDRNGGGDDGGELLRKDIPLVASSCRCRAVKLHQKALKFTPTGAIFELSFGNNNKRLWMAKTRADRQMWMQAIHNAIVGGSVTRGEDYFESGGGSGTMWGIPSKSPFRDDMRRYMKVHTMIRNAKNRQDYVLGLRTLANDGGGSSLKVPVKWIAKQQGLLASSSETTPEVAFREQGVELSIDQLRKDLQRDTVMINSELFRGDSGHGPERIIGALARELMEAGRVRVSDDPNDPDTADDDNNHDGPVAAGGRSDRLQESQALAYARDILLSGNRTRSGGDSYFCVNTLCSNQDLVVVTPSGREAEPVVINVIEDESDVGLASGVIEKSGWIKTRNKSQKEWTKLFFVLSEGTLSFYEKASPRPHRLRGQIVLTDAALSVSKIDADSEKKIPSQFIMTLSKEGSTRERLLLFGSEDRLLDWTYALECTTKLKANADAVRKSNRRRSTGGRDDGNIASSKVDIISQAEQSTKDHASLLGLDDEIVDNRIAGYAKRAASAIVISICAFTEYKVCTLDPQGDEREDTWATIRAHFLQSFRVNGGPNGRIHRGEEIVRVSVVDCIDVGEAQDSAPDEPGSPRQRSRKIFKRFSTSDEIEETLKASAPLDT